MTSTQGSVEVVCGRVIQDTYAQLEPIKSWIGTIFHFRRINDDHLHEFSIEPIL